MLNGRTWFLLEPGRKEEGLKKYRPEKFRKIIYNGAFKGCKDVYTYSKEKENFSW